MTRAMVCSGILRRVGAAALVAVTAGFALALALGPGAGYARAARRMAGQRRARWRPASRASPAPRRRPEPRRRRSASASACSPSRPATSPTSPRSSSRSSRRCRRSADVGYLGFYPLACAGVIAMHAPRRRMLTPRCGSTALLGAVGAATALAVLLNPVLTSLAGEPATGPGQRRLSRRRPAAVAMLAGASRSAGAERGTRLLAGRRACCSSAPPTSSTPCGSRPANYRIGTPLDVLWAPA